MARLATCQGAAFDRTYMQQMVKDYKDYEADVTRVRTHATQGTDPELTRVAANLLSTLETPLTMARTLVQQPR